MNLQTLDARKSKEFVRFALDQRRSLLRTVLQRIGGPTYAEEFDGINWEKVADREAKLHELASLLEASAELAPHFALDSLDEEELRRLEYGGTVSGFSKMSPFFERAELMKTIAASLRLSAEDTGLLVGKKRRPSVDVLQSISWRTANLAGAVAAGGASGSERRTEEAFWKAALLVTKQQLEWLAVDQTQE